MINLYQGVPGSGKSCCATADMIEFLQSGGVVACNFNLVHGWFQRLASLNVKVKLGLKDQDTLARSYHSRAFKIGSPDTLYQLSEKLKGMVKLDKHGRPPEGCARLYLDEAQLIFNSREWKKNFPYIEFLTQHRKLGWDIILIAHSAEMIDAQMRHLIEYETRFRNLTRVKAFGLFPVCAKPRFIAITRYSGLGAGSGIIAWRRLYSIKYQIANLYDSCEVFAFNSAETDVTSQGKFYSISEKKPLANGSYSTLPQYHRFLHPGC